MKAFITVFAVFAVLAVVATAQALALRGDTDPHTCTAPCTVEFPQGMEEDEVVWDFDGNNATVFRAKPNAW